MTRRFDHLGEAAGLVLHQDVRKKKCEGLAPDQLACAPDRVTESKRQLLAREARGARPRQVSRQQFEIGTALAFRERVFELELAIKMIFDHAFVAPGDENEVLNA